MINKNEEKISCFQPFAILSASIRSYINSNILLTLFDVTSAVLLLSTINIFHNVFRPMPSFAVNLRRSLVQAIGCAAIVVIICRQNDTVGIPRIWRSVHTQMPNSLSHTCTAQRASPIRSRLIITLSNSWTQATIAMWSYSLATCTSTKPS